MVRYLCQTCNSTYVDDHECFIFYKKKKNLNPLPQLDEIGEKDAKNDEAKVEYMEISNDKHGKLFHSVQQTNIEEWKHANSLLSKGKGQVSFKRAVKRKRNPYDALVSSSTLNVRENEVHYEENESFRSSPKNCRPQFGFETDFREACTGKTCSPKILFEQGNDTKLATSAHEESKWQSFTTDTKKFMESADSATLNDCSDSKIACETSSCPVSHAFLAGKKLSDKDDLEELGDIMDIHILPKVTSRVPSRSDMSAIIREPLVGMKDQSAVIRPTGIYADLLKVEKLPYVCYFCDKRFGLKSALEKHYRTHTDERPFVCDRCDKGFAHKITLVTHYKKHTREKHFKCDKCKKSFAQKIVLDNHYKTHTGDKSFL